MREIEKAIQVLKVRADFTADINLDAQMAYKFAIQALQEKLVREYPKPLTLEELKNMDGEPVYIVRGLHLPCENDEWWAIIHTFQNCEFAHFISHGKKFSADFEDYGVRWLAFRHKPEHIGEATNMVEGE
ncbi:hypothetical protein [Anaerotignum propionicum]|uniref:hypothetical protein n=1 Tax=Anaerotignum propionicum TaxID=28446 RepID=UPI00289E5691|nr:hypothetical protein [Anaerotignum propionicum]